MAGIFDVGSIAPPGADFASTGPHLHVGVQDASGKYLNPEAARSFLLNRILVGQSKTPLEQQQGSTWNPSYPITSPFGHREAPTAGASTEHMGTDFGVPQGTKLAWSALPGDTYTPDKGYGTIKTTDPQGHPYTVKLLHTTPGGASQLPGALSQQPATTSAATGNTYNFYLNAKQDTQNTTDFLNNYIGDLMSGEKNSFKSTFDPTALLSSAFTAQPLLE
jgi:hypothetical protein